VIRRPSSHRNETDEERIVRKLDLASVVNGLATTNSGDDPAQRSPDWRGQPFAQATGDGEKSCQHKYGSDCIHLQSGLRPYYVGGQTQAPSIPPATRARRRSQWKRGLAMS